MPQFLNNLVTASIHGSIVILAVMALRLLLRKTPKKYICLLWLLAGVRLLMPIEIRSDLSLQPEFTLPGADLAGKPWAVVLPWVWGAVALCFGIYSLCSYLKLKKQVREAVRIRGGWECDKIDTAFILGFIKPRIYIPMGMNRQARKHILAHERTHLDKGDHWIKMIGFLALALHWFNPLVWIAYILLCKDIEVACDERVVQFMELEERKSYSAALLSCSSRQMHFAASPVAFGEVSVKQRILSILQYKKPGFWISMLGVVAFFFVAVCLVTSPSTQAAPVIVEIPVNEFKENTPEEVSEAVTLVENAWNRILSSEKYHLFFAEETHDGSVGWQVNVYKNGADTLWKSTDHINEEGRMVLSGVSYKYIDGVNSGWVPFGEADTLLDTMLAEFSLENKVITDILLETKTGLNGENYRQLTFRAHFTDESGQTVTQPMKVYFDMDGNMTGMRVENPLRKGVDIFSFSCWDPASSFNNMDDMFQSAGENILAVEEVDPAEFQPPSQDQQWMEEWGIQFLVDDDLLTQYGSEVWFCQATGYNMTVHTDNEYWLERKTDSGWEKLEMIAEPEWEAANYALGHGMYTMVFVDWSELYGPLPGGTYRMGKRFEMMDNGGHSCIGYAEFVIYYNETNSSDQIAAVERCYAGLEELNNRESLHWKSSMGTDGGHEYWVNGDNYLIVRQWNGPDAPREKWSENDLRLFPRTDTSVRCDGIGYQDAREDPEVPSSRVLGMEVVTLDAGNTVGWDYGNFEDDFNHSFFARSNHTITFPEGIGVVSDKMVRFLTTWTIAGGMECSAQITYQFDDNGDLCYMEYKTDVGNGREYTSSIRIFKDTAEEIDAIIRPYTEDLVVPPFSWEEAQEKYVPEAFDVRREGFVNKGESRIEGPVDAARLALKEYPDLRDYLSMDVFRDEEAGMWKVTVKNYVDYQSTHCFRDIYLTDGGTTKLLVYEGPLNWDESRK